MAIQSGMASGHSQMSHANLERQLFLLGLELLNDATQAARLEARSVTVLCQLPQHLACRALCSSRLKGEYAVRPERLLVCLLRCCQLLLHLLQLHRKAGLVGIQRCVALC